MRSLNISLLSLIMIILLSMSVSAVVVEYNGSSQYTDYYEGLSYTLLSQIDSGVRINQGFMSNWIVGYPYVKNNTATRLDFRITTVGNPNIIIDTADVKITFDNSTFNLTFDSQSFTYYGSFIFTNATDTNFTITATHPNININNLDGTLEVKKFVPVSFTIYEDENLTERYRDGYNYLLLIPYRDNGKLLKEDFQDMVVFIDNINTWMEFKIEKEIGQDIVLFEDNSVYQYEHKVFHNALVNGYTKLELPEGEKYLVRLVKAKSNRNIDFSNNAYSTMVYTDIEYDIVLSEQMEIEKAINIEYYVSDRDKNPIGYWFFLILYLFGFALLIGISYLTFTLTGDMKAAVTVFITMLVAVPSIIEVLRFFVG